jgi:hypothetical protein
MSITTNMGVKQEKLYIVIAFVLLFLLMFGTVFVISKLSIKNEQSFIVQEKQVVNCNSKNDCDDANSCTIDLCESTKCSNTPIVLCYNNDNCCPGQCNSGNDNDCL